MRPVVVIAAAATPQLPAALFAKKLVGKVIVTELAALQLALETGSAVAVVKAKVADWAVFAATRLAKGMVMDTAVTWPACVPTVPVAEQVVV